MNEIQKKTHLNNNLRIYSTFILSVLCMLTSGTLYVFSSYSEDLRIKMNFSAKELNFMSSCGNTATYIGILIVGPFYDRFRGKLTLLFSAFLYSFGYFMMYLTLSNAISGNVTSMALYFFLVGTGSAGVYMVCTATNLHNFVKNEFVRGLTLGFLLLFSGLSATVYSQVYRSFYSINNVVNTSGFLLFLAMSVLVINGVSAFGITKIDHENICDSSETLDGSQEIIKSEKIDTGEDHDLKNELKRIKSLEETKLTPWKLRKMPVFWLLAFIMVFKQGLTYIMNVSIIIRSISPPASLQNVTFLAKESSLHVTVISIAQSISRFVYGFMSQYEGKSILANRGVMMLTIHVTLLVPSLLLALHPALTLNQLYICSAIVGLGWGANAGLLPGLIKDFFGMEFYGTASGFVVAGVPIGIFMSNEVFGTFYDNQVALQSKNSITPTCSGSACYRNFFIFSACAQTISVVLAIFLMRKSVKL